MGKNWKPNLSKLRFPDLTSDHYKEVKKLKREIKIADLKGELLTSLKRLEDK